MNLLDQQPDLFDFPDLSREVDAFVRSVIGSASRPSPGELVAKFNKELGPKARWDLERIVRIIAGDQKVSRFDRDYLSSLLAEDSLAKALRGENVPEPKKASTIDELFRHSKLYKNSADFNDLVKFMGRFRDYAPYNNMLVKLQNPSCSFYARAEDWRDRFRRSLKEDARPMLILAPMHPVMLVYDLDETEGADLPKELQEFSKFEGKWDPLWLSNAVQNAAGHRIRVDFKILSSTHGGFATLAGSADEWKMRIAIHDGLDGPSKFGVLCHELAHILLGHLGTDWDQWWPGRLNLNRQTVEIEAEAVAHIVTNHLGLKGASAAYVSRHLKSGEVPSSVSVDYIAKVAGHIEQMATGKLQPRRPRPLPKKISPRKEHQDTMPYGRYCIICKSRRQVCRRDGRLIDSGF